MNLSLCLTVAKGQSANMLKISSKRRRTVAQIKADKEAAAQKEAENEARIQQIHELQQRLMAIEQEHETGKAASNLIAQMINSGVVEHGPNNELTVNASQSPSKFRPFENE